MSGLMKLVGVFLLIVAVLSIILLKVASAQMQVYGISPDVIATLFVGGTTALGLGGLIEAVKNITLGTPVLNVTSPVETAIGEDKETTLPNIGFGKKRVEAEKPAVEAAAIIVPATVAATTVSVADTIAALDQAKSDIKSALGGMETLGAPNDQTKTAEVVDIPPEPEAALAEASDELYVVEEKIIRGRPSRILSDDTVEAETDEGWMRFENLEHLNEYLDSTDEDNA
jgi:hypothetical protein